MAMPEKDEEYEIIPHQILSDLRDEIDGLKQRMETPVGELEREMLASMVDLKSSIGQMNALIKSATEQVSKEEKDGVGVQIKRLNDKIDTVSKQNEQIASALLSVANMVEKAMKKPAPMPMAPPMSRPMQSPMPPPMQPRMMPPRAAPMAPPPGPRPSFGPSGPEMFQPSGQMEMPPAPEEDFPFGEAPEPKKKSLMGMLFKK